MTPDELARRVGAALEPIDAVRVAWVFGSRVDGTATARSDLDVAVVYGRELDDAARERARRRVIAALTDELGALGERCDVVDVNRAPSALSFKALARGRRALARSPGERVEAEVRIMRRYDDEAPRRELYRKAAEEAARRLGAG